MPPQPYYHAPLSGGPAHTFLGHTTPVPTTSVGVAEPPAASTAQVASPAGPPEVVSDAMRAAAGLPPGAWVQQLASVPQTPTPPPPPSWLPAPTTAGAAAIQPKVPAAANWPSVAFAIPAGADNRWASVDYLLPRETREGLGGEHRFAEQRKFSATLRRVRQLGSSSCGRMLISGRPGPDTLSLTREPGCAPRLRRRGRPVVARSLLSSCLVC
jgi:hypothetical protein